MEEILPIIVASIGAGASFLLTIVLFSKKRPSLFFLGILFLAFFFILSEEVIWTTELIHQNIHFAEYSEFAMFLIPPSFYLYSKLQLKDSFEWKQLLHFLPALLASLNFLPFYLSDASLKSCYIIEELTDQESVACSNLLNGNRIFFVKDKIADILNIIQLTVYLLLTIPILKQLSKSKAKKVQNIFLKWSYLSIYLAAVAIVLTIADIFFIDSRYDTFSIFYLTIITLIFVFQLLSESTILQDHPRAANYSAISLDSTRQIINEVKQHLAQNENFQHKKITVERISKDIGIPRNKIIYAFSQSETDFKEELNKMRIEKAKKLLLAEPQLTIEAIGNQVGYSSKATFYKYFKQYEGITPSQFLQKH